MPRTVKPKGTPTNLNLYVLAEVFKSGNEAPNQLEATSVPHIRRCLAAGLVEVVGRTRLVLTAKGKAALREYYQLKHNNPFKRGASNDDRLAGAGSGHWWV